MVIEKGPWKVVNSTDKVVIKKKMASNCKIIKLIIYEKNYNWKKVM